MQAEAQVDMHVVVPPQRFAPNRKWMAAWFAWNSYASLNTTRATTSSLKRIVRFTFSQRRKMMKSTLSQLAGVHPFWQNIEFDFTRRPETLSVAEWCSLVNDIAARTNHKIAI